MLSFVLLAFVLSLDAFGAGFTYGLKQFRFPFHSHICCGIVCILCALVSVCMGNLFAQFLPLWTGNLLSAGILFWLGIRMLLSSIKEYRGTVEKTTQRQSLVLHLLGLTITVMVNPAKGDFNRSNTIDTGESIILGLALSLDSFGAGISYGLSGSLWAFPLGVGCFHILLLTLGELLGRQCRKSMKKADAVLAFLPGILLLFFALYHLLKI